MPRLLASDISQTVLPKKANSRMENVQTTFWRLDKKMTQISLVIAITAIGFLLSTGLPVEAQVTALDLESPILPGNGAVASPHVPAPQPTPNAVPIGSSIDFNDNSASGVTHANFVGCPSCGSVGCHGCDDHGPGYACPPGVGLWIRADYLIWYEKNMDTIPLATTSSGFPAGDPDNLLDLDAPETSVLFGGRGLSDDPLNGWRLEVGSWLDAGATFGIYGRYFEVGDREFNFSANSNQFNFLGIPFFNIDNGEEDALEIGVPGERTGNVDVQIEGGLRNFEIMLRRLSSTGSNYRLDWVYGYRNLRLYDNLTISAFTLNPEALPDVSDDTTISSFDSFDVKNQFHGFDIGIMGNSHEGCWSMDFLLKVALGVNDQEITIDGNQFNTCLLYTSPSPRDKRQSRMPSSA